MTPFYDEDGITIYHGDCREILPYVSADIVVTDPPYNAGMDYGSHDDAMPVEHYRAWCESWLALLPTERLILFPGWGNLNWWATHHPASMACWYKPGNPGRGGPFQWAEFEPVYLWNVSFWGSNVFRAPISVQIGVGDHPCPKPLSLMRQIFARLRTPGSILDPFMGSGSTLVAAREAGRSAIGIETEEKYCEIAVQRLAQGVLAI